MPNKTVYFLIDCSGSMYGARADAVNNAMQKVVGLAVPEIIVQTTVDSKIYFKVYGFSDEFPGKLMEFVGKTPVEQFTTWSDIDQSMFNGGTPTGAALQGIINDITGGNRGEPDPNAVSPAIILISDGAPNGSNPTYEEVLECAEKGNPKEVKAFRKSLRVAIGINLGNDPEGEQGRASLKMFGRVSDRMAKEGIEPYYDCSSDYVDNLVKILISATVMASLD